jgi:MFS family permease
MVAADWGRALLLGSIPVASFAGVLTIVQLYVVGLLTGILTVFFDVAYQSYLPSLVGREHLVEGNAKLQASQSVSMVVGPGLGGWLVQLFTAPVAVVADAVSYLASALGITAIRKDEPAPTVAGDGPHLLREIREGLRFVFGQRLLWAIAGSTGTSNLFSSAFGAVSIPFLIRDLHVSAGTVGALFSAGSVGGILGALAASAIGRRLGSARTIWLSLVVTSPTMALAPLTERGWRLGLFAVAFFAFSFGAVVYNVAQVSFRQALCPDRLLGRMNATMRFLVWGTMPLGGILGGTLGEALGNRTMLWIAAVGGVLAPLWTVLSPMRRLRDMPSEYAGGTSAPSPVDVPAGVG